MFVSIPIRKNINRFFQDRIPPFIYVQLRWFHNYIRIDSDPDELFTIRIGVPLGAYSEDPATGESNRQGISSSPRSFASDQ
jgi:hypothetical protein